MKFLNYLIEMPDQPFEKKSSLASMFYKDMEGIFTMVENENKMLKMKQFDP